MAILDRVKNICLNPTTEWPLIAAESGSAGSLISGYERRWQAIRRGPLDSSEARSSAGPFRLSAVTACR